MASFFLIEIVSYSLMILFSCLWMCVYPAENDDSNPLKTLISCLKEIPLPQLKSFTLLQNPSDYYQIKDTPTSELLQKISELVNAASVEGYVFKIPVRTQANAVFDRKLQRYILRRVTKCRPKSGNSEIAYVRTLAVLKSLQKILQKKTIKYVTKRGLYYANKEDFTKQTQLDGILDDITSLLECKREALKIVADEKGVVVGDLRFTECGDNIDCSKVGAIGKPIFPDMAKISDLESNALLVLLVESRATFTMLAAENFHKQLPVIIITGGGIPDLGTRLFLRRLRHELGLPVFAVMDCDPYGIFIMSAYRYGVYSSAFQDLTTPDIKWLGLRPTELDRLDIPNALEGLSHADTNKLHELRNMTCFENAWREELDTMSRDKKKAEFEVLHTLEGYSVPEYLYAKLLSGDWI